MEHKKLDECSVATVGSFSVDCLHTTESRICASEAITTPSLRAIKWQGRKQQAEMLASLHINTEVKQWI
jgi:hypothetical protein